MITTQYRSIILIILSVVIAIIIQSSHSLLNHHHHHHHHHHRCHNQYSQSSSSLSLLPSIKPIYSHQYRSSSSISTKLNAKKKPKLVSDDFLSSLESGLGDNDDSSSSTTSVSTPVDDKKDKKKDKKKNKLGISDDLLANLSTIDDDVVTTDKHPQDIPKVNDNNDDNNNDDINNNKKKKKDKKNKGGALSFDADDQDDASSSSSKEEVTAIKDTKEIVAEAPDAVVTEEVEEVKDPNAETMEQKARREKPAARVRFAESSQPDYVMMGLDKVGLMYGNDVVLKDASFSVTTGERVGLVGPNGGGKTTSLKILSGDIEATFGEVVKSSKNLRVAFLRQEFIDELEMERSLRDELFTSFVEEQALLKEIEETEAAIAKTTDNPDEMDKVLNRLQELQDKALSRGVYSLEAKVDKVMQSMGFDTEDGLSKVGSFSGGWKMRIGLAKILLKDPNILLLDEPTNHLDLDSVYWLEDFLQKQSVPMVIVSHDREFLDKVCNKIVDVEDGTTVSYQGNYSKFLDQKRIRIDLWRDKYEKQQRFVKEEEKWIKKEKNNENMAQQVKAKEMQLERLRNSDEWIEQPPKDKKFRFRFPPAPRCGTSVVEVSKLTHGYGEGKYKTLFENVEIQVDRGERIGFVGPNGSGKSTMMRIISGNETPKSGYAEFGGSNVVSSYFQQNQADALDLDKTVLEAVQADAPSDISFTDIRTLLGQFMFKGDDVDKKIRVLSGGEKGRVALCKMMLTPANLLLLDEPTNHLDITSKEVLEDALVNFEGSMMIISHDRYFMSQVANRIFSFENKSVERYDCDYHDFMNVKGEEFMAKVTGRYVEGDKYKVTKAKEVVFVEEKSKKNYGGSGVTSGNLNKGIKNAKRYQG